MYDKQRLGPACEYAQSDQILCLSLEYSMPGKLLIEQHLDFLFLKGGYTGSPKSIHVKMPHCLKSHVAVHILIPHSSGRRSHYAHGNLGFSLKLFRIAAEA